MNNLRAILATALLLLTTACGKDESSVAAGPVVERATLSTGGKQGLFSASDLNPNVRPQDDFYEFVNGRWLAETEIPAEWSAYGVSHIVFERTEAQIRKIVEGAADSAKPNPAEQQIGALFLSFIDEPGIETQGVKPFVDAYRSIGDARDHAEVLDRFARLLRWGVDAPIDFFEESDADNPTRLLIYLWQGGIGLPDREYYLSDEPKFTAIQSAYKTHIADLFALAGLPDGQAASEAIYALEHKLAQLQWSNVQNRDRERIYRNKFTLAEAQLRFPGIDWNAYLKTTGFLHDHFEQIVLAQDSYFEGLGALINGESISTWNSYLKFRLLKHLAPYLNAAIVAENFHFQATVLRGQPEQRPRWKRGISLVNATAGELLGQAYVARHFPESAKAGINQMVANLRSAFSQSISELAWMTDATKIQAQAKLDAFTQKLGYPDKWRDYSGLELKPDDLVGNVLRAAAFEHAWTLTKLGQPVDRSEWGMAPQTVNAYYRPTSNEIVFPAGILQPPFFDPAADDALNYGSIGAVIGHEFSHGFDDQGRKFDGDGRLRDWWSEQDASEYELRSSRLVAHYEAFKPLPDMNINGHLTLGENIGDLAGVIMAHRAYRLTLNGREAPVIDGYSGDQRFFIGYARSWKRKTREPLQRELLLSDSHSPAKFRVLGTLPNVPAFYQAFNLKEGDGMYLPEDQRVSIW